MRKVLGVKTTSYYTGHEDFMIDIVEAYPDDPMFETWLYRENTGHKTYIIGEYKKNYPGMSAYEYAKTMLRYLKTRNSDGLNFYETYDEEIEDLEIAACSRLFPRKQSAPN